MIEQFFKDNGISFDYQFTINREAVKITLQGHKKLSLIFPLSNFQTRVVANSNENFLEFFIPWIIFSGINEWDDNQQIGFVQILEFLVSNNLVSGLTDILSGYNE